VNRFGRCGLVGVEPLNAFPGISGHQVRVNPCRELRPLCFARRKVAHGGEHFSGHIARCEGIQHFAHTGQRLRRSVYCVKRRRGPHG
jgi:hypothetical protein